MSDKEPLPAYRSREFYVAIGKRGGKRRVEKHGIEAMRSMGAKGGQRTKELNAKGKLYEKKQQQEADELCIYQTEATPDQIEWAKKLEAEGR